MEDMHGVVVGGQTAKLKHSKSLQPADSSEGSERVEELRKVCVCVYNHMYWGAGEQQVLSLAFSKTPEAFMGY